MQNFTYNIPTIINFGTDQLSHLADLRESGDRVLYVYGGGSIKANGLYDRSMRILKDAGMEVHELAEYADAIVMIGYPGHKGFTGVAVCQRLHSPYWTLKKE